MSRAAVTITLSATEQRELEALARRRKTAYSGFRMTIGDSRNGQTSPEHPMPLPDPKPQPMQR